MLAFSEALKTAFPLKGDQDIEELVLAAQSELQTSGGSIAYQRLYTEVSSKTKCMYRKIKRFRAYSPFTWLSCLMTCCMIYSDHHKMRPPNIYLTSGHRWKAE